MSMVKRTRERCFYCLNDRRARVLDLTPASQAAFDDRYRCMERGLCRHLSPRWHEEPESIDVVVDRITKAWVEGIAGANLGTDLTALDDKILDALAPYCRGMVFGRVLLSRADGQPESTRFATVAAPKHLRLQSDRGRFCRHVCFECCGVCINTVGWAKGAIVERTLDDRQVYVNQDGEILVASELVEELELKRRFPRLGLDQVEIVTEPLDKETLPGDHGWSGVLGRTYSAWLDVLVSVPFSPARTKEEREIYLQCESRLNRELVVVGAERVFREGGRYGSCRFCTRGFDPVSLKGAVSRALSGWRVRADFRVVVEQIGPDGDQGVQQFKISGEGV